MRFAWLRTKDGRDEPTATPQQRLTLVAYNLVWWVPIVLPLLGLMSSRAGFGTFLVVTVVRALVNGYRVNAMPIDAAERLPLRLP